MQRKQKTVLLEVQSCSKWTKNRVTSVRKRPPEAALQNCGVTPRPGFFGFCGSLQMADSYPFAFILEGVLSASQIWPLTPHHTPSAQRSRCLQALRPLPEPPHHATSSICSGSQRPPPPPTHILYPFPSRQHPVLCLPNHQPPRTVFFTAPSPARCKSPSTEGGGPLKYRPHPPPT